MCKLIFQVAAVKFKLKTFPDFLGALEKPQITISPALEVHWGDKVEITCTLISAEHLGGTFFLKKLHSTFKQQKNTEVETATFVFSPVDFSHRGSYFCEYEKKLPNQVLTFPQGNVLELSIDGILHIFVHPLQ